METRPTRPEQPWIEGSPSCSQCAFSEKMPMMREETLCHHFRVTTNDTTKACGWFTPKEG